VYKDSGLLAEALAALEQAATALRLPLEGDGTAVGDTGDAAVAPAGEPPTGAAAPAAAARALPCGPEDVRQALAVVLTDLGERYINASSTSSTCLDCPVHQLASRE
jgi:hypothetical protein